MPSGLGHLSYERMIEGIVRDWAAHNPLVVEQVKRAARSLMARRGDDKGKTQEGYLKGGMPRSLHQAMGHKFGALWHHDKTLTNIFWRIFEIGRFNTYETWRR